MAHIHLAFAQLRPVESPNDAWRLFLADELIAAGMTPRALAKAMSLQLPTSSLSKYEEDELRNPEGNRGGGQWTKSPGSGSSASRISRLVSAVPSLTETLGAEALEWVTRLASRLTLPAALFGAAFVPSANAGVSESGAVPGRPGLSYELDHDTGSLRLSLDNDPNPEHALVAQLGPDGIYRDVETKVAIARAVGSNAVIIDLDVSPGLEPGSGRHGSDIDDPPKLCPDPGKDQPGGRKLFDILYEQYVRNFVNPQRQPQLPPGLAFALPADTPSGWVHYDDCREVDGAMIEAKGNYAGLVSKQFGRDILKEDWLNQAEKQLDGAKERAVEWFFHDPSAAAFASTIFAAEGYDKIGIHVLPYPGGVPKPNPRIK